MTRCKPPRIRAATWIALALSACLVCTAALGASIWKWRDANGRVTVSDQPPPRDIPERDILERPSARTTLSVEGAGSAREPGATRRDNAAAGKAAASAPASRTDPELDARRRTEQAKALESAKAAPPDPQAQARKRENCERARALLASLDSGQRLARLNAKGERVVLDDTARAQEAGRAREVIAADCG